MKTKFFAVLAAVLMMSSLLMAQPPMKGMAKNAPQFHPPMPYAQLQLTDEQRTKIDQMRLEFEKEMLPLRDQMKSLQTQYRLKVIDEKASTAELQNLQSKISSLREKMALKRAAHVRKVRALLTDEQKVKFDQRFLSGHKKGAPHGPGMIGPHKGHRGMRPPMGR